MTWAIIILLLIIFAASSGSGSVQTKPKKIISANSSIKPYQESKVYFNVKGIWAQESRIKEFRKLQIGDILYIHIDEQNEYDINALGVYTREGVLLGYIKRNQRKLFKSVRENIPRLVKVIDHEEFFSQPRQLRVYRLALEIWIGYPQEVLDQEEEDFVKHHTALANLRATQQELVEIRKNLPALKKSDPESTLTRLYSATGLILHHNQHVHGFDKQKIPFQEYIDVAYFLKDYRRLIDYYNQYNTFASVTDLQMQSILKKMENARKNLSTKSEESNENKFTYPLSQTPPPVTLPSPPPLPPHANTPRN